MVSMPLLSSHTTKATFFQLPPNMCPSPSSLPLHFCCQMSLPLQSIFLMLLVPSLSLGTPLVHSCPVSFAYDLLFCQFHVPSLGFYGCFCWLCTCLGTLGGPVYRGELYNHITVHVLFALSLCQLSLALVGVVGTSTQVATWIHCAYLSGLCLMFTYMCWTLCESNHSCPVYFSGRLFL